MAALNVLLDKGMPAIGVGTYELRGDDCVRAVRAALQMGYRLVDTAAVYRNEELVGEGIVSSGVPRADIFVVVKIAMKSMGSDAGVREGILESIRKLRIHYADCVLMHWPGCGGLRPENAAGHHAARTRCWRVMTELLNEGKVRHLGVSNFLPRHFAQLHCFDQDANIPDTSSAKTSAPELVDSQSPNIVSRVRPMVNQIELHPLCVQRDVDAFCRGRHDMVLQQYSPLGKGDSRLCQNPKLVEVHAQYFASPMQADDHLSAAGEKPAADAAIAGNVSSVYSRYDMILMWGLAQGYCTLVRSRKPEHLQANLNAAKDYFASIEAPREETVDVVRTRPLLTPLQLNVIRDLRRHIGLDDAAEDVHLCWHSSEIA